MSKQDQSLLPLVLVGLQGLQTHKNQQQKALTNLPAPPADPAWDRSQNVECIGVHAERACEVLGTMTWAATGQSIWWVYPAEGWKHAKLHR